MRTTVRKACAQGAGIALVGALLALAHGVPSAAALALFAILCAAVLGVGLAVYGTPGAVGALFLFAVAPALGAATGWAEVGALSGGLGQVLAASALLRCVLDPSAQWAVLAGAAIGLALPAAVGEGRTAASAIAAMAAFAIALVVVRAWSAERCERRGPIVHGALVSLLLAAVLAAGLWFIVAALREPAAAWGVAAAAGPGAHGADDPVLPVFASLPVAMLLAVAVRPWQPRRRYTDATWGLAVLCLGLPLWWSSPTAGGVALAAFTALLAGACWDAGQAPWRRAVAWAAVALQAVVSSIGGW